MTDLAGLQLKAEADGAAAAATALRHETGDDDAEAMLSDAVTDSGAETSRQETLMAILSAVRKQTENDKEEVPA